MRLGVLSILATLVLAATAEEVVRISAPDIDPMDGTFEKSIRISMVANARTATIHYTIDGSAPTDHSPVYKEPFDLVGRGQFIVRAIAVSDIAGRNTSIEVSRRYVIKALDAHATISPSSQTARGFVNVSIASPQGSSSEYLLDYETQWRPYTGPFVVSVVGQREVKARLTGTKEPVVSRYYTITPPLVFDVTTFCEGCGGPTRCAPFTVWLQGARDRSQLFLTSSSHGCENINHILDGTSMITTDARKLGYKFTTSGDAGSVWVCLAESGDANGPFTAVSRRKSSGASFTLTDSQKPCRGAQTGGIEAATAPPPAVELNPNQEGFSLMNAAIWASVLAGLAWFIKVQRASSAAS